MRSPLELWIALFAFFRLRLGRRRARRLVAQGLERTRQLLDRGQLRLVLRPVVRDLPALPPAPKADEARGDYPALQLGAQLIRSPAKAAQVLFRLAALPPPQVALDRFRPGRFGLDPASRSAVETRPIGRAALLAEQRRPIAALSRSVLLQPIARDLGVLRLRSFLLDEHGSPASFSEPLPARDPARFEVVRVPRRQPPPLRIEPGAARPELLGLDEQLRPPTSREPPALSTEHAFTPKPGRHLRPRMPLQRKPIRHPFDWRAFRADRRTGRLANEGVIAPPADLFGGWLLPTLWAEIVEVRHLETRFLWPPPTDVEWHLHWIQERRERTMPGGKEAIDLKQPEDIFWKMEECKEQMLIRRDVSKDEQPPEEPQNWAVHSDNPGIGVKKKTDLAQFFTEKQWIESSPAAFREIASERPLPGRTFDEPMRERSRLLELFSD